MFFNPKFYQEAHELRQTKKCNKTAPNGIFKQIIQLFNITALIPLLPKSQYFTQAQKFFLSCTRKAHDVLYVCCCDMKSL